MSDFCPDGYLSSQEATFRAAKFWFPDQMAALETAASPGSQTKADSSFDAAVRAFSQPQVSDVWRRPFEEIVSQTVDRLRNFLHQGTLKAYYFGNDGSHRVSREFWATANADGVIETGTYWPFGKPTRSNESLPNYSLFLSQSELDEVLSEQLAKKRPFPRSKMLEFVAALRKLEGLPNRSAQLHALRNTPEFREFNITDALFREAARRVPRQAGRKSWRQS
jgi:hypothetical protein